MAAPSRRARAAVAAAIGALLLPLAAAPGALASGPASPGSRLTVVVSDPGRSGDTGTDAAAAAVRAAGGTVLDRLPLIGAVAATLPSGAALPAGLLVAPDRPMTVASTDSSESDGPPSNPRGTLGERSARSGGGSEGNGVTVAVVDTGIANVPDLAGRVVAHIDVTGEGTGDGYGHGTFMAGLIAGSGAGSDGLYTGIAPAARLLDVKVAGADGSTSLVTVLRGLQVVARRGPSYGVRVLNLSLSSGSPMPYQLDPLTQALEALWRSGVTIVVPAGNAGPDAGTVSSPGVDPVLITAGALDENGTSLRSDDVVTDYSGRGPAAQGVAKPDLAAPGNHVVSLRDPGSTIDVANPSARVGDGYFRGSGTSMSTAVTSGAIAAVLAVNQDLSPDGIKALLTGAAYQTAGLGDPSAAGAGGLDLAAALTAAPNASNPDSSPTGSLSADDSAALIAFAQAWSADDKADGLQAWHQLSPQARAWAASAWAQLAPDARAWAARAWAARAWADANTSSEQWLARAWAARAWAARAWAGRAWAGRAWADENWDGRAWAGRAWADDDWAARAWTARAWTARAWTVDDWS